MNRWSTSIVVVEQISIHDEADSKLNDNHRSAANEGNAR
jgi:hypothetical protein